MDNIADGGQKPKKGKMMSVAGFNPMAVSQTDRKRNLTNKKSNRVSAPLGAPMGLMQKNISAAPKLTVNNVERTKVSTNLPKGTLSNILAQSQRAGGKKDDDSDDDMMSVFAPPANDFYNKVNRLSIWSKSDVDDFIIDGHSSEASDDCDIKRISDEDSFTGRSQRSSQNSIAGMSRGSMSSTGSKGIRNILGSKFVKRANTINKKEPAKVSGGSGLLMPGQSKPMGVMGGKDRDNTIIEDIDSDCDMSAEVNYNYDIVNLKDEASPYHQPIRDILSVH